MKYHALILFVALGIIGCEKEEQEQEQEEDLNLITIELISSDSPDFFRKTVILYENWTYLVKTNFETYINEYPFDVLHGYEDIKLEAIADTTEFDVIKMVDYLRREKDSIFVLAHHLENGTCLLYDKRTESVITTIQMEVYMEGGPMSSMGGRRFYINGRLFLETVDLIS
jgi:hypothetical protein